MNRKPQKAKPVKAWCGVTQSGKLLIWSVDRLRQAAIDALDNNGWFHKQYRIARVEVREL